MRILHQDSDEVGQETLGQLIYNQLEDKIMDGEWLPETKVSLRTLASALNTSVQPVREALGRLIAASALEVAPNKAFKVPSLDRAVMDEVWALRLLLEGEAAAKFAMNATSTDIEALIERNEAFRAGEYVNDPAVTMRTLMAWNKYILRGSRCPILTDMVLRLYLRYAPFLAFAMGKAEPHDPSFLQFSLHFQDELVMAIAAGDAAAARYLRCADLRAFQRYLYDRIGWSDAKSNAKRKLT